MNDKPLYCSEDDLRLIRHALLGMSLADLDHEAAEALNRQIKILTDRINKMLLT